MHSFQNRLRHNCNGNVRLFINSSGRIKKHIWIPTFLYTVEHSVIINKKSYLGLLLPQFAALSRTSTPQILPPPPKMVQLCVRILYARSAIYKTLKPLSLISLNIFRFSKNAGTVPSLGDGDICINSYTKLMLIDSASRFMQRISKIPTWLPFQHPNYVCFDAYKAKYVHTAIHDL